MEILLEPTSNKLMVEIDFRNFMMEGVDGESKFLLEEGNSPSTKSVNNEAPVIHAEPITAIHPLRLIEDISNSVDVPFDQAHMVDVDHFNPHNLKVGTSSKAARKRKRVYKSASEEPRPKAQKVQPQASKSPGVASEPLDVDNDPDIHEFPATKELKEAIECHFVVSHVTPPSWKKYLKETSLENLYDIHEIAYIRQAILDNTLNKRTRKLMSALLKARASCDAIREKEAAKDKAYAKLERK
nr:hypothetical protein [Tanacetum cinerariifolium]